jgi:hypothetical protein|tara:strand:- start:419 stop:649 length:231 start_codon:yes stop_codon:yes gene_type:complete
LIAEKKVQVFIDKKEIMLSHQNILLTIQSFLPYLTNDDIEELVKTLTTLKDHRRQKENLAILEAKNIPIQSNRHDT